MIAGKYEEIYPPTVKDYVYITDKAYTREDLLRMEQSILSSLDFNFCVPSNYRFLERFSKITGMSSKAFSLAQYFIEISLLECKMLKYIPSLLSATSVYLSIKIVN